MIHALTIDLEDWYQGLTSTAQRVERWPTFEDRVVQSTHALLHILDRAGVKATFFVLGYVAEQFPELIAQVAREGHEIGLHGYYHRFVTRLTPEEFQKDLLRGRAAVEKASGQAVLGFRAPYFSIGRSTQWALLELYRQGFRYDSSVFPTRNMLYGYPDAPRSPYYPLGNEDFVEFPLATIRMLGCTLPLAGGFYLRVMPYALFRLGLQRLNRRGQAAVIYLHPWELDPGQPVPHPTPRERFTHYYGLRTTANKLTALLGDFQFKPLSQMIELQPGLALSSV